MPVPALPKSRKINFHQSAGTVMISNKLNISVTL